MLTLLENSRSETGIICLFLVIEKQIRKVSPQGGNTMLAKLEELVVRLSGVCKSLQNVFPSSNEIYNAATTVLSHYVLFCV